jgi:predicted trehalose synthase
MQGNCGSSLDGQTLTLAQIQSDFPGGLQAYAWVAADQVRRGKPDASMERKTALTDRGGTSAS